MKKKIVILGSTGSIGKNAIKVVEYLGDELEIVGIAAGTKVERLAEQAESLQCPYAVIGNEEKIGDYGIFAANFLFLPTAIKLGELNEDETFRNQIVAEGLLAISNGDLPIMVRKKLNNFLIGHLKEQETPKASG